MNRIYMYRVLGVALLCMAAITNCAHSQKIVYYSLKNSKTRIGITKGDITKQRGVEVIVNAANEQLQHGGGVAAAISKAAGPELQLYCDKLAINGNAVCCKTGCVVLTPAFNLKVMGIKNVIHAVGPRIAKKQSPTVVDEKLLYAAYTNSLQLAVENKMRSIAFPAISTAKFGYDSKLATPVAIRAVFDFIKSNPNAFDEVRFVVFSGHKFDVYKHIVKKLSHKKTYAGNIEKPVDVVSERPVQNEEEPCEKSKMVEPVAQVTWPQWIRKHPYLMISGSLGLAGLTYGAYSMGK